MKFSEFQLALHKKDIGLSWSVVQAMRSYCTYNYGVNSKILVPDQYLKLFSDVDDAHFTNAKIVNPIDRDKDYYRTVDGWALVPWTQKKGHNDFEPLMVFYYFLYHHTDNNGQPDPSFGNQIARMLYKENTVAEWRNTYDADKTAPSDNEIKNARPNEDVLSLLGISDRESAKTIPAKPSARVVPTAPATTQNKKSKTGDERFATSPNYDQIKDFNKSTISETEEKYFNRTEFTQGRPDTDPKGIVRSLIFDGEYGLLQSEKERKQARRLFGLPTVRSDLGYLLDGYNGSGSTRPFSIPNPANDEIQYELMKFDEPSSDYMRLMLTCVGNHAQLGELVKHAHNPINYALYKCMFYRSRSRYLELCSFFLEQIGMITDFSDFTRGVALYLKTKMDTERGAADDVFEYCKEADTLLGKFYRDNSFVPRDDPLLSELSTQRTSNFFTTTRPANLNMDRLQEISGELAQAKMRVGLNEEIFDNPDLLANSIKANGQNGLQLYIPSVIHYSSQILRCYLNGDDATEFFNRHKIINMAVAEHHPDTALVVLTPMIGLASFCNLGDVVDEFYNMRHGGHLNTSVNTSRNKIDNEVNFGVEPAIALLTTYFTYKRLAKYSHPGALERMTETKAKLLSLEEQYQKISLQTVKRYYARFKADVLGDKHQYIISESHDAESHHMYFGPIEDKIIKKA